MGGADEVDQACDLRDSGRALCDVGFTVRTDMSVPGVEVALGEGDGARAFSDGNLRRRPCVTRSNNDCLAQTSARKLTEIIFARG